MMRTTVSIHNRLEVEVMTHDPLCPNFHLEDDCTCEPRNGEHDLKCACWDCECDIIAKVRDDERAKVSDVLTFYCRAEWVPYIVKCGLKMAAHALGVEVRKP